MKLNPRSIALCAVLTALALGLSTLENLFPVTLIEPLPGVKLGLANIVTVFALYELGAVPALTILTARCLLAAYLPAICRRCCSVCWAASPPCW